MHAFYGVDEETRLVEVDQVVRGHNWLVEGGPAAVILIFLPVKSQLLLHGIGYLNIISLQLGLENISEHDAYL